MVKKGTIGVRIADHSSGIQKGYEIYQRKGSIIKSIRDCVESLAYSEIYAISPSLWRKATEEEIFAYNRGCRNISDIKNFIQFELW